MFALETRPGAGLRASAVAAASCVILALGAFAAAADDAKSGAPVVAAAPAGGPSGAAMHGHSGMAPNFDKLFASLDLTPDQKTRVQRIMIATIGQLTALKDQVGKPKDELHDLLVAPTVDRAAFEALRAREMAVVDRGSRIVTDAFLDVAQILTPEQRARLAEKIQGKKAQAPASMPMPAPAPRTR